MVRDSLDRYEECEVVLGTLKGTAFRSTLRKDLRDFYGYQWAISTNSETSVFF